LQDVLVSGVLVTVKPERAGVDLVITRESIGQEIADRNVRVTALIVRTLPNDDRKLTAEYGEENIPPYFTADAMEYIVGCGFRHLLVDMPSIDRLFDEGKLRNHRIFWNVEPGSRQTNAETRMNSTITELIYVPNQMEDGEYLLNLQIAPFESDCAPSRPMLLRAT
jgi:kynurenine formamidase